MYLVKPTWIILVIMALGLGFNQPVAATASLTINPITLSEEEVANHDYVLKLNSPNSPLSYCTEQTIDLDFYFTLTLSKGLVWDTSIHSNFLSIPDNNATITLVGGGLAGETQVSFLIRASQAPFSDHVCLTLGATDTVALRVKLGAVAGQTLEITATMVPILNPQVNLAPVVTATVAQILPVTHCAAQTEIPPAECSALLSLYHATQGPHWSDQASNQWNVTSTPCTWAGITCANGHLIRIDRRQQNLVGELPDFSALTELETLWLDGNQLRGKIPPAFSQFKQLIVPGGLNLDYNQLISDNEQLLDWLDRQTLGWRKTQTVPPLNVMATAISESAIVVAWTPIPYLADNGYYQVTAATTSLPAVASNPIIDTTLDKSASYLTLTGLMPNTTYYLIVETVNLPHAGNPLSITSVASPEVLATTQTQMSGPRYQSAPIPNSMSDEFGNPLTHQLNLLDLGRSELGTPTTTTLTMIEVGDADLEIGNAQIIGEAANDFSIIRHLPPLTIAEASPPQVLVIQCLPSRAGKRTATLTLSTNDPDRPLVNYLLFCLGIGPINSPPVAITLSSNTIDENSPGETLIGEFSTYDPDLGDSHIYTLRNDTKGQFVLQGNQLKSAPEASFDFEAQANYTIIINSLDSAGNELVQSFLITVQDVSEFTGNIDTASTQGVTQVNAPEAITLTGQIKPRQADFGKFADVIAIYQWTLPGTQTPLSFSMTIAKRKLLTAQTAQQSLVLFKGNLIGLAGDFTVQLGYQCYDGENLSNPLIKQEITTLTVQPNHAPTAIELAGTIIPENSPPGTLVGTFTTRDPDQEDKFTYSLVDAHSANYFQIIDNQLRVGNGFTLDFEQGDTQDLTIRSTDATGDWIERTFTLQITDAKEPGTIRLTHQTVLENTPSGGVVGRFYQINGERESCHYQLLQNGDGHFELNQDLLVVAAGATLDLERQPYYEVTVQCQEEPTTEETFTLTVLNQIDVTVEASIFDAVGQTLPPVTGTTSRFEVPATAEITLTLHLLPDITHRNFGVTTPTPVADLIVVALYLRNGKIIGSYQLNDDAQWQDWGGEINTLIGAQSITTLPKDYALTLLSGVSLIDFADLEFQLYVGYRLNSTGDLIYSPTPISIQIY